VSYNGFNSNNPNVTNNGTILITKPNNKWQHNGSGIFRNGPNAKVAGYDFINNATVTGSGAMIFSGSTTNQGAFTGNSSTDKINFYDETQTGSQFFDFQNVTPTNTVRTAFTRPTELDAPTACSTDYRNFALAGTTGTITGTVYTDSNLNNVLDATETKLPNITVWLYDSTGVTLLQTKTTDASGSYSFTGVAAGTYQIKVDATDVDRPAGATIGTTNPLTAIAVTAGGTTSGKNFGFDPAGTVSGTVYTDSNLSNALDATETKLPNITVWLYDSTGVTLLQTKTTDTSGAYSFTGVAAGTYQIKVDATDVDRPAGATMGTTNPLTAIAVTAGGTTSGKNFGFDPAGTVSGTVYTDSNLSNALDATETKLPNITVWLYNSTGTSILQTTATDASGSYSFTGVTAGTYQVKVDATDVDRPAGTTMGTTNPLTAITVTAGGTTTNQNFGFDPAGIVSGTVYTDSNGSNALDATETKLPNITVWLYDSTGVTLLQTKTTDASGAYSFTGVTAGTYQIKVDATDVDRPAGATMGTTNPLTAITVTAGGTTANQNFGFDPPPGTVSGMVYTDSNLSNALDATETKLPNITVWLYDSTGVTLLQTKTTDASGSYTFTTVPVGSYQVEVDTTDTDLPAGASIGTANPLAGVAVTSGATTANQNFGFDTSSAACAPPAQTSTGGNASITWNHNPFAPASQTVGGHHWPLILNKSRSRTMPPSVRQRSSKT
jgi:uncharacterized surface anchored protein